MAIRTTADFNQEQNNASQTAELNRKMLAIESQTIAWVAEATALHGVSHADDKPLILAMRDDLIARLRVPLGV